MSLHVSTIIVFIFLVCYWPSIGPHMDTSKNTNHWLVKLQHTLHFQWCRLYHFEASTFHMIAYNMYFLCVLHCLWPTMMVHKDGISWRVATKSWRFTRTMFHDGLCQFVTGHRGSGTRRVVRTRKGWVKGHDGWLMMTTISRARITHKPTPNRI